jgi:hypothetical protein
MAPAYLLAHLSSRVAPILLSNCQSKLPLSYSGVPIFNAFVVEPFIVDIVGPLVNAGRAGLAGKPENASRVGWSSGSSLFLSVSLSLALSMPCKSPRFRMSGKGSLKAVWTSHSHWLRKSRTGQDALTLKGVVGWSIDLRSASSSAALRDAVENVSRNMLSVQVSLGMLLSMKSIEGRKIFGPNAPASGLTGRECTRKVGNGGCRRA